MGERRWELVGRKRSMTGKAAKPGVLSQLSWITRHSQLVTHSHARHPSTPGQFHHRRHTISPPYVFCPSGQRPPSSRSSTRTIHLYLCRHLLSLPEHVYELFRLHPSFAHSFLNSKSTSFTERWEHINSMGLSVGVS